jgi:protein TonB
MLDAIRAYLGEHPLIDELGPSGRQKARRAYQRRFAGSLFWAVAAVQFSAFAADRLTQRPDAVVPDEKTYRIIEFENLVPPAVQEPAPDLQRFAPKFERLTAPPEGDPVPVPAVDAEAISIRSQIQNTWRNADIDTGLGTPTGTGGDPLATGNGGGLLVIDAGEERPDPAIFRVVEVEPRLLERPLPVYPVLAREARIEGTAIVRALVGRDGKVKEVLVARSAHDLLDRAAAEATRSYVFTPALQGGRPVAVWVSIPFRFTLRD